MNVAIACVAAIVGSGLILWFMRMSRHYRQLADASYRASGFSDAERDAIRAKAGFYVNWFGGISRRG